MWKALMNEGGGPGGDSAPELDGGSPSPSPTPALRPSSANPTIQFDDPLDEGPASGQPASKPGQPFYKRGERAFASQKELDSYLDEVERGGQKPQFDPDEFEERLLRKIEERYVRGEDDDQPRGGRQQPQQFTREENPFDRETQPGEWAEHEVKMARGELEHKYDSKFQQLEEQLGTVMSAQEQAQLRSEYQGRFQRVIQDPRIARDIDPDMLEDGLLQHLVGIDPKTKDDFTNLHAQASVWARRLKAYGDRRDARNRTKLEENGRNAVPSVTRGAAAPNTRQPRLKVENPGSLEGKDSTYNRLARTFSGRPAQE